RAVSSGSIACSGHIPSLFAGGLGAITIISDPQTGSPCPASNGTGSTDSASTGCQANIAPDSPRAAATRVVNLKGRILSRSATCVPNPFRYHFTGALGSPGVALMAIGRATEQRDERAAFQLIQLHPVPASQGQIAGYRIASDRSAGSWEARREAIAPAEVWAAGATGIECVGRVGRREPSITGKWLSIRKSLGRNSGADGNGTPALLLTVHSRRQLLAKAAIAASRVAA